MHINLAHKTMALIDRTIAADNGNSFRTQLKNVMPHIGDIYRVEEDRHRAHMGASILGNDCARAIWYNFRWATVSRFDGRMLRLFNRGHIEEARFLAMLLMIGVQVYQQDKEGNQFRISHSNGHIGGSGDGIAVGIPDLQPGMSALLEAKTHNEKSFRQIAGANWKDYINHYIDPDNYKKVPFEGRGVREAKTEHYVQSSIYMRKMGLPVTLYMAVNKDTDELYCELIPLNPEITDRWLDRGEQLVYMDLPPDRINKSPGFWKCRFCDHRPVCHLKQAPDFNCRTCTHSRPNVDNKAWHCSVQGRDLTVQEQLKGCEHYSIKPGM